MPAAVAGVLGTAAATGLGASAATAGLIGAGVSAAGSLIGGALQGGAISGGASAANGIAQQTINEAKTAYQPFITQGTNGLTAYADLTGVNGADAATNAMANFQASPGVAYQEKQGLRAVDAAAASKGMLRSGSTLKAEQTLGSNLADQDFAAYTGRLNTLANFGLSGTNGYTNVLNGQSNNQEGTTTSAAGQQASIYGNTAQGVGNAIGLANKNGLFDNIGAGTSYGTFGGAGMTTVPNTLSF